METTVNLDRARALAEMLQEELETVIETAKKLAAVFGDDRENTGKRIDSYLVGALENFLDNERQCGSIPDILNAIEELHNPDDE